MVAMPTRRWIRSKRKVGTDLTTWVRRCGIYLCRKFRTKDNHGILVQDSPIVLAHNNLKITFIQFVDLPTIHSATLLVSVFVFVSLLLFWGEREVTFLVCCYGDTMYSFYRRMSYNVLTL